MTTDPAEARLRAAVFAAPADDAPRAVYADWLLERGDPFGEFIALQLKPSRRSERRVRELVAALRDRILGSLAPHVYRRSVVFERGFLAETELAEPDARPPAMPEWATVVRIVGDIPATDEHPMPVLATARGLGADALAHLATLAAPPPLTHLGVGDLSAATLIALAPAIAHLAILERVELERYAFLEGVLRQRDFGPAELAELGWFPAAALPHLTLPSHARHLPAWMEQPGPRRLTLADAPGSPWTIDARRTEHGRVELELQPHQSGRDDLELVFGILARLRADSIDTLRITNLSRGRWRFAARQPYVQRVLARHPRIDPQRISGYTSIVG